ncbi:hypothetical protein [Dryocola sp. BD626]|uniref:hypothetical protein n=1 Tax=Dryocola sp. BD626 TaxID=3133273 RepID=UPI003F501614
MNIIFLASQDTYESWFRQLIQADSEAEYPSLLNQTELDAALVENQPVSFPCLAYIPKSATNCLDERPVYVYEEEFSRWKNLMNADKTAG